MFDPKRIFNLLSSFIQKRKVDREIDLELRFHLDLMVEEYIASGMTADEARKCALERFGDINKVNDICREIQATETAALVQDIGSAFKTLLANPRFSALAIFTLCLGSSITIALFSVVNLVLWRPIPFKAPEQLVVIQEINSYGQKVDTSNLNFLDFRDISSSFEYIISYSGGQTTVTGGIEPERNYVAYVSRDFFSVFGVEPIEGRPLQQEDHQAGANPTVVISQRFWQSQLNSGANLTENKVMIAGRLFTVVGVMPASTAYPREADLWVPRELFADDTARSAHNLKLIARMKSGINLPLAQTELSAIGRRLENEYPESNEGQSFAVISLQEHLTATARTTFMALLLIAALVLFVACGNVANLLIIRNSAHRHALASRFRLGASPFRLSRQLIVESILLSLGGSLLGLAVSGMIADVLLTFTPHNIPDINETTISGEVLAFTFGIAILIGLFSGLMPALRISQTDWPDGVFERSENNSSIKLTMPHLILTAKLATAVVLLIMAGTFAQNLWQLSSIDPGFSVDSVLTADVSLPQSEYREDNSKIDFYRRTLERLSLVPGIKSAGIINNLPLSGQNINGTFYAEKASNTQHNAGFRIISPGYFQSLTIPLVQGRFFTDQDNEESAPVAIISKKIAEQIWTDQDPVGHRIKFIGMDSNSEIWMTVIGVVGDVRHSGLSAPSSPDIYVPYTQRPFRSKDMTIVMRTEKDPHSLIAEVRREIRLVERDLPVRFEVMNELLSKTLAPRRHRSILLFLFAFTAVVLTLIGFYVVMRHDTANHVLDPKQTLSVPQMGIISHSVRKGVILSATGLITGSLFVLALPGFKPAIFFGVTSVNPGVIGTIAVIIFISSIIISYIAARSVAICRSL